MYTKKRNAQPLIRATTAKATMRTIAVVLGSGDGDGVVLGVAGAGVTDVDVVMGGAGIGVMDVDVVVGGVGVGATSPDVNAV